MSNKYVRTGEAARMLGVHRKTIIVYIQTGKLSGIQIETNKSAGTYQNRVSVDSIKRFIEERKQ